MYSEHSKKGWNPARQHCESMGMTLATLDEAATAYLTNLTTLSWYTAEGYFSSLKIFTATQCHCQMSGVEPTESEEKVPGASV
nr:hypothetical protein BaRGS_021433 [Batillaria attramentaria]